MLMFKVNIQRARRISQSQRPTWKEGILLLNYGLVFFIIAYFLWLVKGGFFCVFKYPTAIYFYGDFRSTPKL